MRTIREVAMGYLARREHSRQELALKLRKKQFTLEEISACIDWLESKNYLCEHRFLSAYTRHRSEAGFGPRRIHAELMQRGIHASQVDSYWSSANIDWDKGCLIAWRKKFNQSPRDYKTMTQQTRFLLQRGFEPDRVQRLLQSIKEEADHEIHDN